MRFNCDCWDKPSCTHGPSAATVVIGDCELAHPVDSLVVQPTNSKSLKVHCIPLMYRFIDIILYVLYVQLLDAMHKYKRAEVVYDNLDLVYCVIKLLTMISGNKDCRKKLVSAKCCSCETINDVWLYIQSSWTHNITEAVFTDPPVSHCGTMYMVTFILLSSRLWKSDVFSRNVVFPRMTPVK